MGFYDTLANYYDEVFPLKEKTYQFLKTRAHAGRVLDVGCSTGAYATKLSEDDDLIVKGIDLNEEMIKIAKRRVGTASFEVKDLRKIDDKNRYSLIYSIGNTLVHLDDYDEIKDAVGKMINAIQKDGKLIIQIVNYARVFNQVVSELPVIETKNIKFSRFYQHKDGKIVFKSVLKTKLDKFTSEVMLYPLTKAELEMIVENLKATISFYGSFEEEPYKDDSFHLIAVIEK